MVSDHEDADWFLTVEDGPESEWVVKGSSFLAQSFSVADEESARRHLDTIRRRYHDATHHCWAYRLVMPMPESEPTRVRSSGGSAHGPGSQSSSGSLPSLDPIERWDDNGEPSGTAGQPILGALRHAQVLQATVVVTRYFGGTKLGTGGLSRAYADAARLCLEKAGRKKIWRLSTLEIRCGFDLVGAVESVLSKAGASVHAIEREFAPEPIYRVRVAQSRASGLAAALIEGTAGKAVVRRLTGLGD